MKYLVLQYYYQGCHQYLITANLRDIVSYLIMLVLLITLFNTLLNVLNLNFAHDAITSFLCIIIIFE